MDNSPPPVLRKRRIRRIAPLQLGKILGVLYALLGLLFIPFLMIPVLLGVVTSEPGTGGVLGLAGFSIFFAVLAPIFYGVMGFVFGALGALIYNGVAGWIGGIEVEIE